MKWEGTVLYSVDHPIQEVRRRSEKHLRMVLNYVRRSYSLGLKYTMMVSSIEVLSSCERSAKVLWMAIELIAVVYSLELMVNKYNTYLQHANDLFQKASRRYELYLDSEALSSDFIYLS
jgi:hypothetical protein